MKLWKPLSALLSLALLACNPPKNDMGDGVSVLGSYEDDSFNLVFLDKQKPSAKVNGKEVFADQQFRIASLRGQADIQGENTDLYYASFSNPAVLISLESYGKILYRGKDRAVMKITKMENVEAASAVLHTIGGLNCGGLQRVLLDELVPVREPRRLHLADDQIPASTQIPAVVKMIEGVNSENIRASLNHLVNFGTRHYRSETGIKAADWVAETYQKFANARSDIEVTRFQHRNYPQQSVIARIKGTTNPDKIVIIGSHVDSINLAATSSTTAKAPGADDNASGASTLLEAFRVLVASGAKYKYTIEFHAYAAEEPGLLGSQDIAQRYKSERKDVVSMVQIDMNGYIASGAPRKMWLVSNNTNAALNTALGQMIDGYIKIPWGSKALTAGSSDHASWTRTGVPAAFPFEDPGADNPAIHTLGDTPDKLDTTYSALYGKLVLAYVGHYALIEGAGSSGAMQSIALRVAAGSNADSVKLAAAVDATSGIEQLALCPGDAAACRSAQATATVVPFSSTAPVNGRRFFAAQGEFKPMNDTTVTLVGKAADGRILQTRSVRLKRK